MNRPASSGILGGVAKALGGRGALKARRRLLAGTRNALELLRLGRLGEEYGAAYEIVDQGPHHKLRRYGTLAHDAPSVLLVPPLMVTAEVYDVAPDVSAVGALGDRGVAAYVVDFGSPEREQGGMKRTLDDHVRGVVASIRRVTELTGRAVHVAGYSQGGMFAYQAAAYLRGENVASLVTFGSPVDVHKNLPAVRGEVAGALAELIEPSVERMVARLEGLPGALTSTAFKLVSTRKEIQQRVEFVRLLHDRSALVRREARRRFLGGEGFVAWPGPAFRDFAREFVVNNRLMSGGFVIDGRTVSLADVRCPVLCFWGAADEIASSASVRAIARAAPHAEVSFVEVPAGHFGLVVGSRAMKTTWPTVAEWVLHREGSGPEPSALRADVTPFDDAFEDAEADVDLDLFLGSVRTAAKDTWRRFGDFAATAADALDAVRYQEPRLRHLAAITPSTAISPARALATQAAETPDATFFLWNGRAFSFAEADLRVSNVTRGLFSCGVRPGDRVLVLMRSRPSLLSMATALNRLGAVAVVVSANATDDAIARYLAKEPARFVTTDPEHAARCAKLMPDRVLVLGGGGGARSLGPGVVDMEAIDPEGVALPASVTESAGFARDLAMILLRPAEGELRPAQVTNHRWALSALGAAAACTLKPGDTVYCAIPLSHPTALLACVGSSIVAGSRLALAERFEPDHFFSDARRVGASVVFYAGEMLRSLLSQEPSRGDRSLPIRVFAGSGMRADLAERLRDRFGVGSLEFYASTSLRVVLANVSGKKLGALGRPLPGSAEVAVVRSDERGSLESLGPNEVGVLAARGPDGAWVATSDVVRMDEDGDYWFLDAQSGFAQTRGGSFSTRAVEDAFYALPEITMACAFAEDGEISAVFSTSEDVSAERLSAALAALPEHARPLRAVRVALVPMTEGFRPDKRAAHATMSKGALARYRRISRGTYERT